MTARFRLLAFAVCATAALAGCKSKGDIVVEEGIGITALRTVCPAVGVPDYTGDVTLFNGEQRTASAMALRPTNVPSPRNHRALPISSARSGTRSSPASRWDAVSRHSVSRSRSERTRLWTVTLGSSPRICACVSAATPPRGPPRSPVPSPAGKCSRDLNKRALRSPPAADWQAACRSRQPIWRKTVPFQS